MVKPILDTICKSEEFLILQLETQHHNEWSYPTHYSGSASIVILVILKILISPCVLQILQAWFCKLIFFL